MGSKLRMKSFSLCVGSKGLVIKERKAANEVHRTALLLNFAGEDVQENLNTLTNAGTALNNALNVHFIPKVNGFRSMVQCEGETGADFVPKAI